MTGIESKVVAITGASGGIGEATALLLAERGARVVLGARRTARLEELVARIEEVGGTAVSRTTDVRRRTDLEELVALARERFGRLDVLVNNAGISGPFADAFDLTLADYEAVYATNVFGIVRVTHAFLPLLRASSAPVIVNVSSGLGSVNATNDAGRVESGVILPTHTSSKAAVNMLSSQWSKALPGLRVNAVDPGYTATDFNGHQGPQTVEEGASPIVRMALVGTDGPTGTFEAVGGSSPW